VTPSPFVPTKALYASRRSLPSYLQYALLLNPTVLFFLCRSPASTQLSTLSLHDALPISSGVVAGRQFFRYLLNNYSGQKKSQKRSEEHTSELQSRFDFVCRLLLEKKNV